MTKKLLLAVCAILVLGVLFTACKKEAKVTPFHDTYDNTITLEDNQNQMRNPTTFQGNEDIAYDRDARNMGRLGQRYSPMRRNPRRAIMQNDINNNNNAWQRSVSRTDFMTALNGMGENVQDFTSLNYSNNNLSIGGRSIETGRLFQKLDLPSQRVNSITQNGENFIISGDR